MSHAYFHTWNMTINRVKSTFISQNVMTPEGMEHLDPGSGLFINIQLHVRRNGISGGRINWKVC